MEETLAEFKIRRSFTVNFAAAHEEERHESTVRGELVAGIRRMCRDPSECIGVGIQRPKRTITVCNV